MTPLAFGIGSIEIGIFAAIVASLIITIVMRGKGILHTPGLIIALIISIVLPPINVVLLLGFWFYRSRSSRSVA
ncbi:hypothetical protein CGZ95_12920 [Enemella evansiae]|uniref:hypothetical protein n=1 Tax=Enemella evansiae TaxID=2016499 RepID=UPI000B972487|nr:hypothetical protein [Enemella evansiae]OYN98111.1 hypothetical protein CGZ95_12920 [Enemella evansiae]